MPQKLRELLNRNNKTKEEVAEYQEKIELEKGDFLAMVIAAIITYLPILIIVMVVFYGVLWILMGRG